MTASASREGGSTADGWAGHPRCVCCGLVWILPGWRSRWGEEGVRKGRGRGEEASSTLPELGHRQAALQAVLQVGSVPPRQQTDSSQIKQLIWHWDREQTALLGTVCPDTGQLHN